MGTIPLLLGIEIGGTKLQVGVGRGDGEILALERRTVRPRAGAEGIRNQLLEAFAALSRRGESRREVIEAVGIGFGGPIDSARGLVITSNQIAGWDGFPIAAWVRDVLGIPLVALQNDADTAALGEARFGAGRGLSPVLYVTIGSGIGGGLVVDGRIYAGSGVGAMEIGHLRVRGSLKGSQEPTDLELLASGWSIGRHGALVAEAQRRGTVPAGPLLELVGESTEVSAVHVAEAARRGDPHARSILDQATNALAEALSHAVNLLAPRRIILGGGVSLIGESDWFEPIRRTLASWVYSPLRETFDIVPAALGEEVVVQGAIALAFDLRERH